AFPSYSDRISSGRKQKGRPESRPLPVLAGDQIPAKYRMPNTGARKAINATYPTRCTFHRVGGPRALGYPALRNAQSRSLYDQIRWTLVIIPSGLQEFQVDYGLLAAAYGKHHDRFIP